MLDPATRPVFPPVYTPVVDRAGEAFGRAVALAQCGADAGTLVWIDRRDAFDCAIVLEPEGPLAQALPVILMGAVALGEALAALGPPNKPVAFAWPDRVLVDGGLVGGLRVAASRTSGEAPAWAVVGAALAVESRDAEPGLRPDRTALHEEGFGDVSSSDLAESFSRRFLLWMDRWQERGIASVLGTWRENGPRIGARVAVELGRQSWQGRFAGLGPDGALQLGTPAGPVRIGLEECLRGPSFSLEP